MAAAFGGWSAASGRRGGKVEVAGLVGGYSCGAGCGVRSPDWPSHRAHFKSQLHRYNVKAQAEGRDTLSAPEFEEAGLGDAAESSGSALVGGLAGAKGGRVEADETGVCDISVTLTDDGGRGGRGEDSSCCRAEQRSSQQQHSRQEELQVPTLTRERSSAATSSNFNVEAAEEPPAVVFPSDTDRKPRAGPAVGAAAKGLEREALQSSGEATVDCLFCTDNGFHSVSDTLDHMRSKHSFVLPLPEYCVDVAGVLLRLAQHIGLVDVDDCEESDGDESDGSDLSRCLWCCRLFPTLSAARAHMVATSHCRLDWDASTGVPPSLAPFYDLSAATLERDVAFICARTGALKLADGRNLTSRAVRKPDGTRLLGRKPQGSSPARNDRVDADTVGALPEPQTGSHRAIRAHNRRTTRALAPRKGTMGLSQLSVPARHAARQVTLARAGASKWRMKLGRQGNVLPGVRGHLAIGIQRVTF